MRFGRSILAVVGLLLATLAAGQVTAWPVKPKDPEGFHISHWGHYPQTASPTPGHTVHNLFVAFDNSSTQEVASVEVEVKLLKDGKTILTRSPIHIDRYRDHYIMNRRSSIPGQRAFQEGTISFDLPVGAWEPGDGAEAKILSFRPYKGKQDLHDLGHFTTWFKTATDAQVAQAFAQDPRLREVRNEDGYTPLAVAYFFGNRKTVETISGGTNFGQPIYAEGLTSLHLAARNPTTEVMDAALALGADVNARSNSGATPLMLAANNRRVDATRWLLRHGADAETVDRAGWNALRYAIRSDDANLVRLLVDHGARIIGHRADGFGPMHDATDHEVERILGIFLGAGLSVNDVDPAFGVTPLMAAAKYRSYRSIRWLLKRGAVLDAKDRQGRDALSYAKEADLLHGEERFRQAVAAAKGEEGRVP